MYSFFSVPQKPIHTPLLDQSNMISFPTWPMSHKTGSQILAGILSCKSNDPGIPEMHYIAAITTINMVTWNTIIINRDNRSSNQNFEASSIQISWWEASYIHDWHERQRNSSHYYYFDRLQNLYKLICKVRTVCMRTYNWKSINKTEDKLNDR